MGTISGYRAALSSALKPVDGYTVGNHPLVVDLIKGMTNMRPREFKSGKSWEVDTVLLTMKSWGVPSTLDMSHLTWKTAMLMALSSGCRCSELTYLDARHMQKHPGGVSFTLTRHKKNRKAAVYPGSLFFPYYKEDALLCPVTNLEWYLIKTAGRRTSLLSNNDPDPVFRAISKPFAGVTPATVSRWITQCIMESGHAVPEGKSWGHSTRGKAAAKADYAGLTLKQIMEAQEWKSESVFKKFYYQPTYNEGFGKAVLTNRAPVGTNGNDEVS